MQSAMMPHGQLTHKVTKQASAMRPTKYVGVCWVTIGWGVSFTRNIDVTDVRADDSPVGEAVPYSDCGFGTTSTGGSTGLRGPGATGAAGGPEGPGGFRCHGELGSPRATGGTEDPGRSWISRSSSL